MDKSSYHLLLVDDDPILQSYLSINLTQQGFNLIQLTQGESIESILQEHAIDLVILDVMLTGKDGFYWLEWLHSNYPHIETLMLTAKTDENDRVHGLELGAMDYLSKPFNIKELQIRIENILMRRPKKVNTIVKFGRFSFNTQIKTLSKQKKALKLTHYESELLAAFCQHKDKILSRNLLSQTLNGKDYSPFDRRIDVHVNRLRNKIEEDPSSPQYIQTVRGKGYRFQIP